MLHKPIPSSGPRGLQPAVCRRYLGCLEHVLAKTVDYAKQRTTFGAPIGKYQAVAHRLVDRTVTTRQLRLLLAGAVALRYPRRRTADAAGRRRDLPVEPKATEIVSDCIQLCGGIGFTWEWGHHLYLRRVAANGPLGSSHGRPARRLAQEAGW